MSAMVQGDTCIREKGRAAVQAERGCSYIGTCSRVTVSLRTRLSLGERRRRESGSETSNGHVVTFPLYCIYLLHERHVQI